MLRQNVSSKWSRWLAALTAVSAILVVVIGALLKVNPTDYQDWPIVQSFALRLDHTAWWTIPCFAVISAVSQLFKKKLGESSTWYTVHYLLNQYRDALFEKHATAKDDPEYYHRVTLFRHVQWRWAFAKWPWSGWMIPVARTGHTTHSWRIPRFRARAADPDSAEGVAGQTWVRAKMVPVPRLPEINLGSSADDLETYSRRAFVSSEWVMKRIRKRKPQPVPRSLLGIPLEVGGEMWGALVVDSRSEDDISNKRALGTVRYKTLTEVLSKLLQSPKAHPN